MVTAMTPASSVISRVSSVTGGRVPVPGGPGTWSGGTSWDGCCWAKART